MIFLPIVERELRVAARKRGLFWVRLLVAVFTIVVASTLLIVAQVSGNRSAGGQIFSVLVILACFYCLIEGLRSADVISEEKREGTLGLLFLTDLRGYDVVLGKFAAVAIRSFHGLLAFLPVLACAFVLGGVTGGEFWRAGLALLNTLFLALGVGLLASAVSQEANGALVKTVLWLAIISVAPVLLDESLGGTRFQSAAGFAAGFSPFATLGQALQTAYPLAPGKYWLSLFCTHALGWLALGLASWRLSRNWHERSVQQASIVGRRWRAWYRGNAEQQAAWRKKALEISPAFWLAVRNWRDRPAILTVFVGFAVFTGASLGSGTGSPSFTLTFWGLAMPATLLLATLLLKGWLAWRASQPFAIARQSGAMELILATPLTPREWLDAHSRALRYLFLWPALLVLAMNAMSLLAGGFFAGGGMIIFGGGMAAYNLLRLAADFLAIAYVGTWMGLTRPKPTQAFFYTLLVAVFIPSVLFCVPNLVIDLALYAWTSTRLIREFHRDGAGDPRTTPPPLRTPPPLSSASA